MSRFILIDVSNLFFRVCYANSGGDAFNRSDMALHLTFRSIRKVWRQFKADHVVFCLDDHSWRYEVYPAYKANRRLHREMKTEAEREQDEIYKTTLETLIGFLNDKTRCTVLRCHGGEADDVIARWIHFHPSDQHIILSSDSDFLQLLAPNVTIYDGMRDLTIGQEEVLNDTGQRLAFVIDTGNGKIRSGNPDPQFVPAPQWWEWLLFLKIMRGDKSDNIFSAYPGVRVHGGKTTKAPKPSLENAWADRHNQGYCWNNLMLQTWTDIEGKIVRVLDAYERNKQLIDLTCQPEATKTTIDETIAQAKHREPISNIGIHFLRFCHAHSLVALNKEASDHAVYLNAGYITEGENRARRE